MNIGIREGAIPTSLGSLSPSLPDVKGYCPAGASE